MLLYPTYQSRLFLNVGPTRKHFFSSSKRRFPPLLLTRARASSMFCSLRSMLPKPYRSHNLFFDFYGKGKNAPCKPLLPQVFICTTCLAVSPADIFFIFILPKSSTLPEGCSSQNSRLNPALSLLLTTVASHVRALPN